MAGIKVIINGRGARETAERLVKSAPEQAQLLSAPEHQSGTRSLDLSAIVAFFENVKPVAETIGSVASTAYVIWKWSKESRSSQDKALEKEHDSGGGTPKRLELYEHTSLEEIEAFLYNTSPLDISEED